MKKIVSLVTVIAMCVTLLLGVALADYQSWELEPMADTQDATHIILKDGATQVEGNGAMVEGDTITIYQGGTYVLSGALSNGQVVVDSQDKNRVYLLMDNASITCQGGPALLILNAEQTIISLNEGTSNDLADAGEAADDEEYSACLYSKDDLVINGLGTLTVQAARNDGISCRDELKLVSGTLNVTAQDDGIVGKDYILVKDMDIHIQAQGDGMKSSNSTDAQLGYIAIEGGNITIDAQGDGIQAETFLTVSGGSLNITSGGGSAQSETVMQSRDWGMGGWGWEEQEAQDWEDVSSASTKGLKAETQLTISGGTLVVDALVDAVHSNGNVTLSGGDMTLSSGDDAIHADSLTTISGGIINILTSVEGIEGADVNISGGQIKVVASDNGLNASGTESTASGRGMSAGNANMTISGGEIWVNASGDGIDVNGQGVMTGGMVYVSGPTSSGDGALDYDTSFTYSGGTLVAAGASGMAQGPSSGLGLMVYCNSGAQQITVTNASGQTLITYTPEKTYGCVVICSDLLTQGETYTVQAGGETYTLTLGSNGITSNGSTTNQPGGWGNMGGGGGGRR